MNDKQLRFLLRRALWTSLASTVACGNTAQENPSPPSHARSASAASSGSPSASATTGSASLTTGSASLTTGSASLTVSETSASSETYPVATSSPSSATGASTASATPTAVFSSTVSSMTSTSTRPHRPDASVPCEPITSICGVETVVDGYTASCFDGGLSETATYTLAECVAMCRDSYISGCNVVRRPTGEVLLCNLSMQCTGRRPAGLARRCGASPGGARVGRFFAEAAYLEAASVDAFAVLEDDLVAYGAPPRLVRAAARARADEVRHARMTARLARRHGGDPGAAPPRVSREVRSLEAIAIENAVEGCVRETFGALVAMHQAKVATDPEVRKAMGSIAGDETRHAALGWAVATWASTKLTPEERERVRGARDHAVAALRSEVVSAVPSDLARTAGVPPAELALRMVDALNATLWG